MKKIVTGVLVGIVALSTSCEKYLDINANPNSATSATPELILPQALTNTASVLNSFNRYGSQIVGYSANAGGIGGFGEVISYNFTTEYTGIWATAYDNLEDYQAILDQTDKDTSAKYNYFNAVARIMKVHGFQLLVDAFNDVPYFEALQGAKKLTPAYTDAKVIYKDLAEQLDKAIATIDKTTVNVSPLGASDVLFHGEVEDWKKFANTLKLRIMLRAGDKVTFANKNFSADGFLETDALINPGYIRDAGKQNPAWDSWTWSYTGTATPKSYMPNTFVFGYYDGTKIEDPARGKAIYYEWPATGTNRLGYENIGVAKSPAGSFWYSGTDRDGKANGNVVGILKGPNAGYPIMLAAESYFLQAEGALKSLPVGNDADLFNKGILSSFEYLFQLPDGSTKLNAADSVANYMTDNNGSRLVNYTLAGSPAQKLEAIITQKYIALNFIHGHEAWNEYRRTHYPVVVPGGNGYQTFASTVSQSTRPDKLPTRIMYPVSEGSYNSANVPKNISPFSSLIFWAQ